MFVFLVVGTALVWTSGIWLNWPWLSVHPMRAYLLTGVELLLVLLVAWVGLPGQRGPLAAVTVPVIIFLLTMAASR